jgi:Tfp pilus assembly protein PilZ
MKPAKKWMVKLYQPEADSVKWRFLFNFLGVESVPLCNEKELVQSLLSDQAGLLVIDRNLLGEAFTSIGPICLQWIERGGGIALTGHAGLWPIPDTLLGKVVDISERDPFTINALLQRYVPTYSRQHPRLGTRLPGLYSRTIGGNSQICEIMNLSPGGAFIRTAEALPLSGEELQVNIPLMGLRKELELNSCVVSQYLPNEANNYAQGVGVRFITEENSSDSAELNNYVRYVLANDAALDPQAYPAAESKSRKIGHKVKSEPARPGAGHERKLVTNF